MTTPRPQLKTPSPESGSIPHCNPEKNEHLWTAWTYLIRSGEPTQHERRCHFCHKPERQPFNLPPSLS